jgi:hypothetical protein
MYVSTHCHLHQDGFCQKAAVTLLKFTHLLCRRAVCKALPPHLLRFLVADGPIQTSSALFRTRKICAADNACSLSSSQHFQGPQLPDSTRHQDSQSSFEYL